MDLFKQFFELPNVFSTSNKYATNLLNSSQFSHFVQGEYWKEKIVNFGDKIVIPFHLYFDDWKPDNPLGSHKKLNSIAATYVVFKTIPKQYISLLENILVVQLFKSKDKVYGDKNTYLNLVKECVLLEKEGIRLKIDGETVHVYFVLGLILGDNLGIHEILGLTKSFVANFTCRFCKVHRNDLHVMCTERDSLLRTEIEYQQDVRMNNVSETGIKSSCVFSYIPSFKVTNNISVDIMHDLYEGVCHYNLAQILNYLVFDKNYFSLDEFNNRKAIFKYGTSDISNISQPIQIDHIQKEKFNTSASEMRAIFQFITFFVGEFVPKSDPVWKFVRTFVQILDLITGSSINSNQIQDLKVLVKNHHTFYVSFFKQK